MRVPVQRAWQDSQSPSLVYLNSSSAGQLLPSSIHKVPTPATFQSASLWCDGFPIHLDAELRGWNLETRANKNVLSVTVFRYWHTVTLRPYLQLQEEHFQMFQTNNGEIQYVRFWFDRRDFPRAGQSTVRSGSKIYARVKNYFRFEKTRLKIPGDADCYTACFESNRFRSRVLRPG